MKKLFIYYSLTGNGDVVANVFKDNGYEIRKVVSKCKYSKNKFFMILMGGYKATFNKRDELVDFDTNIKCYDKIVIASPVWNDMLSSPINSVLSLLDLKNKDLSFILYSASGYGNKAKEKIKNLYEIDATLLKEPKKNKEELTKLSAII